LVGWLAGLAMADARELSLHMQEGTSDDVGRGRTRMDADGKLETPRPRFGRVGQGAGGHASSCPTQDFTAGQQFQAWGF